MLEIVELPGFLLCLQPEPMQGFPVYKAACSRTLLCNGGGLMDADGSDILVKKNENKEHARERKITEFNTILIQTRN